MNNNIIMPEMVNMFNEVDNFINNFNEMKEKFTNNNEFSDENVIKSIREKNLKEIIEFIEKYGEKIKDSSIKRYTFKKNNPYINGNEIIYIQTSFTNYIYAYYPSNCICESCLVDILSVEDILEINNCFKDEIK